MEAVRRHPGPIETSRLAVAAKAPVGALGVEIVERDVGFPDAPGMPWRALLQPMEEKLAEQKRRQVVDRPGQFDAVLRQLPCSYIAPALLTSTSSFG